MYIVYAIFVTNFNMILNKLYKNNNTFAMDIKYIRWNVGILYLYPFDCFSARLYVCHSHCLPVFNWLFFSELTVYINMFESIEDRLHELVVQGRQLVVVQLEPLQRVQVVKRARRNPAYAEIRD